MLTIRLRRVGKKKQPEYRMIVQEKTSSPYSGYVERVGHYNPRTKDIVLDKEKIANWLARGAQPSNTVAKLLKKEKIELPAWVEIKVFPERPSKAELKKEKEGEPKAGEAKAESKSDTASKEAPAEEKAEEGTKPSAPTADASSEAPAESAEGSSRLEAKAGEDEKKQ